jgi:hypothetical protein
MTARQIAAVAERMAQRGGQDGPAVEETASPESDWAGRRTGRASEGSSRPVLA